MMRADNWLVRGHEAAYLWFYDRTGVYLGTVAMAAYLLSVAVQWEGPDWGTAIGVLFGTAWAMVAVWRQAHGQLEAMNRSARGFESFMIRRGIVLMLVVFVPFYVLRAEWAEMIATVPALNWIYLMCAQVRDREPPEKTETKLATQHN